MSELRDALGQIAEGLGHEAEQAVLGGLPEAGAALNATRAVVLEALGDLEAAQEERNRRWPGLRRFHREGRLP